jgi:two-component system OmpR family response regulator
VPRLAARERGADHLHQRQGQRELSARIRAVLRRGGTEDRSVQRDSGIAEFDGFSVSLPRRELVSRSGGVIDLTGAEFDLLTAFLDNAQRVIARERLIELSRTRMGDSSDRSVDVLVSRLRRKLSSADKEAPIITIRGVGYMLNAAVTRR